MAYYKIIVFIVIETIALTRHHWQLKPIINMSSVTSMQTNNYSQQYGALITFLQAAEILDRSPNGLRTSLASSDPKFSELNSIKVRLGRRVYFPSEAFFEVILKR